ncbi:MAG: RnfH family protein [Burkholderiaceae bacterium]|nr:MAG: RnfH family protein [Burkholderiaceae bacterium]
MAEGGSALRVVVAATLALGAVQEVALELPAHSRVADALAASGLAIPADAPCGIWGRTVERQALVSEGDRVEVYRPLVVDPKVARRERFARQGARGTGLFARQRPGGKAGY